MASLAVHGLCDIIVSDNGTSFTSAEFKDFLTRHGIKHVTVAPHHPSSNGLAEKAVQIVKAGLMKESEGTLAVKLCRVLYKYRVTPHSTTQETPAKLLMGRHLKTPLDLLRPNLKLRVEEHQRKQKVWHESFATFFRDRRFGLREKLRKGRSVATCQSGVQVRSALVRHKLGLEWIRATTRRSTSQTNSCKRITYVLHSTYLHFWDICRCKRNGLVHYHRYQR